MDRILYSHKSNNLYIHHTITNNPDSNEFSFRSHSHNMYEIYYFLGGDAEYAIEGKKFCLKRGSVIVTERGQTHNIIIKSSKKPYERIAVLFTRPTFSEYAPLLSIMANNGSNLFVLSEKEQVWFEECINILKNFNSDSQEFYKHAEAVIKAILSKINILAKNILPETEEKDNIVREIVKFINSNLEKDWNLDTLEKTLFRDKAYLNRKFKGVMGCGIWEYNLRKRIFSAQQQLSINQNIGAAFAASGFKDYSTFYRKYKKYIGKSPSEDLKEFKKKS